MYYCRCEDLSLATLIPYQPVRKHRLENFCHVSVLVRISDPHANTHRLHSFIVPTGAVLFAQPQICDCTGVCPCGVYECVTRAHLAELRCAGSSCGPSAGVHPCILQDALISFAQAEPRGLSGAQWTVPK